MAIIPTRTPMPTQAPAERIRNFEEVSYGYTKELALQEAQRCLNCKAKPCVAGCPVNIDIPNFISKICEDKLDEAYDVITESSSLPAVCGRVCPHESHCESLCT